jgi:NADH-quinone oxidoreductase subunit E
MADRTIEPDSPELRARWGNFAWTPEWAAKAKVTVARYPEGRQRSAVMAYLDFAQRQVGEATNTQGWLPIPVIEFVARELGMPVVRVLEVATFYTMYNLVPVGRYHVQVCGTTPCMLRGSDDIIATCEKRGMHAGHTTDDGLWTFTEVECMGNCASAPMVQINDDNYEDLTAERMDAILDALARGEKPKTGTQEPGRHTVEPVAALSSLTAMVDGNHDYRGEWA